MNRLVPKKTGTYADTLQAIGTADLISELCGQIPQITDEGAAFRVSTERQWAVEKWPLPSPGYPYIWDSKKEHKPPAGNVLDYRAELTKRDAVRESARTDKKARQKISKELKEQGMDLLDPPKAELSLAAILASMRKGWDGDRNLYKWLSEDRMRALHWTKQKLGFDGSEISDPDWSNTQFLNPITGKGVHSPKTVAREANAINAALIDPFEDWLKLRAAFIAMLAYRSDDDFKLFVLEPVDAKPSDIAEITAKLRKRNIWGGVRLDIQAVLRCTEELIRHSDVMVNGPTMLKNRRPRDVLAGLRLAYFKSLGTAAALMQDALLPLPDWFVIRTREDAIQMLNMIDEFIGPKDDRPGGCLGSLQEKNSDDGSVLQQFRNWLTSARLQDLLSFHASFAGHLIAKRARRDWARPFSTENLSVLFSRRYAMTDVVGNSGFQSIARAIRNATIYSVGDGAPSQLSTRFGLAQEWKQKLRAGKAEFLGAVADFVQQYNWEVINRFKRQYHVIQTHDLDDLARLLDSEYGAETVGLLLLAYGYAQAPKTEPRIPAQGEEK